MFTRTSGRRVSAVSLSGVIAVSSRAMTRHRSFERGQGCYFWRSLAASADRQGAEHPAESAKLCCFLTARYYIGFEAAGIVPPSGTANAHHRRAP